MYGEAEIEATERALQGENIRAVAHIRGRLTGPGSADCADCGAAIPQARRRALPSATRCVACQSKYELGAGR